MRPNPAKASSALAPLAIALGLGGAALAWMAFDALQSLPW
jgi:hypothetical protein